MSYSFEEKKTAFLLIQTLYPLLVKNKQELIKITDSSMSDINKFLKFGEDDDQLPKMKILNKFCYHFDINKKVLMINSFDINFSGCIPASEKHWSPFDQYIGDEDDEEFTLSWNKRNILTSMMMKKFIQDNPEYKIENNFGQNTITFKNISIVKKGCYWGKYVSIEKLISLFEQNNENERGWFTAKKQLLAINKILSAIKNKKTSLKLDKATTIYFGLKSAKRVLNKHYKTKKEYLLNQKNENNTQLKKRMKELSEMNFNEDNWFCIDSYDLKELDSVVSYKVKLNEMINGGWAKEQDSNIYLPLSYFYKTLNIMGLYECIPDYFDNYDLKGIKLAITHNYNHFKKGNSSPRISDHYGAITATNPKKAYQWVIDCIDKSLNSLERTYQRQQSQLKDTYGN